MALLIKNGKVIDIKNNLNDKLDILIEGKKIVKIGKNLNLENAEVFDAKEMLVIPGLIDMHAHLREPGREDEETLLSGSLAAACGGFTSVCCMPNTDPVIDNQGVVEFILAQSQKLGLINIYPIGALTKARAGKELTESGDLKTAGVVALSDDGNSLMNAELMRRAMEYASMFDLPIISHCEDTDLSAAGVMNEGYVSTILGLKGIPRIAEIIMVSRDIELARFTQAKLHIAHVSCKESVDLIRRAKKEGVNISSECCPHHFTLTDEALMNYDTNTKVNPPLRTKEDCQALKEALKDGTIDCISTDHAPHTEAEKDVEFDQAPFGMVGLETAVGLAVTELVDKGVLTIPQLVEKMSFNPAQILKLDKGYLAQGAVADLALIDPQKEWVVESDKFFSKSRNTPFNGKKLKAQIVLTIASGKIVFDLRKTR